MNLPNNTLVLVADGRKMLFLRNHGNAAQIDLRVEAHREQDNPPSHDQGSDAPGRSFASIGSRRSAMEETDFHQIAEDRFAAEAADLLRARAWWRFRDTRCRRAATHAGRTPQTLSQGGREPDR